MAIDILGILSPHRPFTFVAEVVVPPTPAETPGRGEYLGRYQQGQECPLYLYAGPDPDAAPHAFVYGVGGTAGPARRVPLAEARTPGYFQGFIYLNEDFPPGSYGVSCSWAVQGEERGQLLRFTVGAGGDPSGQVIALFDYRRPHASFLVQQRSSGVVMRGKNAEV